MGTFFSSDSALMRGLGTLADIMLLNLIFVVASVPVLTLGASLTALNFTAMRIATGECNSVAGDFVRSFRQNFRQATVIGLLLVLMAAVLAAWFVVVTNLAFGPLAELVLLAVWYVLAFNFAIATMFVFPYLASFEGSTRAVLRNARLLSWKHPFAALAGLTLIALCAAITVFYPQYMAYGLFWFLFGFAGIAVANAHLFIRIFKKYTTDKASREA